MGLSGRREASLQRFRLHTQSQTRMVRPNLRQRLSGLFASGRVRRISSDGIYATQKVDEVGLRHWRTRGESSTKARTSSATAAHQGMAGYRQLYDIEQAATSAAQEACARPAGERLRRTPAILQRLRLQVPSVPFRSWPSSIPGSWPEQVEALPKSPLGQAVGYAPQSVWRAHGATPRKATCKSTNNPRRAAKMKRVAIGRKNWMFAGSDQGGATAAVLFWKAWCRPRCQTTWH